MLRRLQRKGQSVKRSLDIIARGRGVEKYSTHEEEDTIHVALPTFREDLVILLALLENDTPELCGRIHVLDLCKFLLRKWPGKYLMTRVP